MLKEDKLENQITTRHHHHIQSVCSVHDNNKGTWKLRIEHGLTLRDEGFFDVAQRIKVRRHQRKDTV